MTYVVKDFRTAGNSEVLARFQSLGDNCEVGLVQERTGAEPIDLLRFAGFYIPVEHRLDKTIEAIQNNFDGLGDDGTFDCALGDALPDGRREFYVEDRCYRLRYHTFKYEGEIEAQELLKQQSIVLKFWRRKFLEDMELGGETYIWKSNVLQDREKVSLLHSTLQKYSRNRLLCVQSFEQAAKDTEALEDAGDGLFFGSVKNFAPYDRAWEIDVQSWINLCALVPR